MNKSDLLKEVSNKSGINISDTRLVINTMIDVIKDSLIFGMDVKIKDFISFTLHVSPPLRRPNPQTGKTMIVPKKYRVKMSLPKAFKDKIKEKTVY